MNTNELDGFRYSDMKASLVDIQYGSPILATFRVFLPPNSDDERIYKECERIPIDVMFRYLVAIHYKITVTTVDARVIMVDSDEAVCTPNVYALYVTCRGFYCNAYMGSLIEDTGIFAGTAEESNIIHSSTFIETLPVYQNKETDTTINGIFHVSTVAYGETQPYKHASRLRPYGISINIQCLNAKNMKDHGCPEYDIREHNALYNVINNTIVEFSKIIFTWMIYETTAGFKSLDSMMSHMTYHFVVEDKNEREMKNQLSLYVMMFPDGLFNLKFVYTNPLQLVCTPIDIAEKKKIQFHDMDWGYPLHTLDPVMRRMETIYSYLLSTPSYTMVSQCDSMSRMAVDDAMEFVFHFTPAVIPWATGILPQILDFSFGHAAFENSMCDYLIARTFNGVDLAFPVNGQNPRRGVILYMRYSQHIGIDLIRQVLPLTSKVPIYSRVIAVNAGYVVSEFIVDETYDLDTVGYGSQVDKYFPNDWFPTTNYQLLSTRGHIEDWGKLSDENKRDTIAFFSKVVSIMFTFQLNEKSIMDLLGGVNHFGVLYEWMNTVGIPDCFRPCIIAKLESMGLATKDGMQKYYDDHSIVTDTPKKGILSRIFGK